jgi:hypothetical protein
VPRRQRGGAARPVRAFLDGLATGSSPMSSFPLWTALEDQRPEIRR